MRKLHAVCINCACMRSWEIQTVLSQYGNLCIGDCTCVMCGDRQLISFKLEPQVYSKITAKGYEIPDEEKQQETPKPPYLNVH
jgi:hypothetical protein